MDLGPAHRLLERRPKLGVAFNNVACTSSWHSSDNFINQFENVQRELVRLLGEDPGLVAETLWIEGGILPREDGCDCRMVSDVQFGPRTGFACPGCVGVGTVTSLGPEVSEFKTSSGQFAGWQWRIHCLLAGHTRLKLGPGPGARARAILQCSPCAELAPDLQYMACDPFSQWVLVSCAWEHFARAEGIQANHVLAAFICSGLGYLILENNWAYEKIIELPGALQANGALAPEIIRATLIQLFSQLKLGQKVALTLGSPSLAHLQVLPQGSGQLPFRLVLVPGPETVLNVSNKVRLYPSGPAEEQANLATSFHTGFDLRSKTQQSVSVCQRATRQTYRLNRQSKRTFRQLRALGLPIFQSSIDLYLLFISLLCFRPFYLGLQAQPQMYAIWQGLWSQGELVRVESLIRGKHGQASPSSAELFDMVVGLELQCNPLNSSEEAIARL